MLFVLSGTLLPVVLYSEAVECDNDRGGWVDIKVGGAIKAGGSGHFDSSGEDRKIELATNRDESG